MALSTSKVASQLSNRQRRMLHDMGIDVFTERRTPADARSDIQELTEKTMPLNVSLPNDAPSPSARAIPDSAPVKDSFPASVPAPVNDGGNPPTDTQVRIELNVVATSGLIHLGETPLSAQELRFLQDLASALHWARTRKRLDERLRNSQLLWPIVEATGTPQRAITVFCQKHHLFSDETAVLITPGAQAVLAPWVNNETSHWIRVETLDEASSSGAVKRALWLQAMQSLPAARAS